MVGGRKRMIIPASIRFKGTYDIVLRDTITGKIKEKRKIDNMLLNEFKRFLLGDMLFLREINNYGYIYIGTDNTPPSRSDTGIIGTSLASIRGTTQISSPEEYPFTLTITVTFPAGTGTGNIGEIVLYKRGSPTDKPSPNYGLSRIALDPKIDKTDTDELIVTYTLTAYRLADVISGTISGGQRDGVTDINWKFTFNNDQLYYFLYETLYDRDSDYFGNYVRLGDSNADSDLINDKHDTLKGNEIASFTPFHREWLQYSPENGYRDLVLGFEKDQGKGNIAEIVLYKYLLYSRKHNGVCRVTFDPPLDNTDPNYRLYLTFRFYIDGEETDVTIEGNNNNG
jgi:hypothetical protein